jgi:hypothetical protein
LLEGDSFPPQPFRRHIPTDVWVYFHHDKTTISAILFIQLQHRMTRRAGTGEEV